LAFSNTISERKRQLIQIFTSANLPFPSDWHVEAIVRGKSDSVNLLQVLAGKDDPREIGAGTQINQKGASFSLSSGAAVV